MQLLGRAFPIAALLACMLLPAAADATWPGKAGRVAYWSLDGVHTIGADGKHDRVVLPGLTGNAFAWSPNGREIAYGNDEVWRARADGSDRHVIVAAGYEEPGRTAEVLSPAWGPEGDKLVFTASSSINPEDQSPPGRINWIWSVHRNGTHLRKLARGREAVWSGSGAHIRFIDEDYDIVEMNADGSGRRVLASNSASTRSLDLSPDGTRLVYETAPGRTTTFRTLSVRNGARTKFSLTGKFGVGQVVWAPGGKRLACLFRPGNPKRYQLRTIRPDGHGIRKVLTFPKSDWVNDLAWQTR